MSAFVIVDIDVRDPVRYEEYKLLAPPAIALYGGKFLARGGEVQVLEGNWSPKRCVVLEFPSADVARQWWDSPEYAAAKRLRQETTSTDMVLVAGL